jgi:catalase
LDEVMVVTHSTNGSGHSEKSERLADGAERSEGQRLTTNQGTPVGNNQDQLTAGPRGPALLEDFVFREKMMHFDHERIPERVVHPRGSGAHGYFQVYEPMAEYTKAAFLQDPSVKTPVFVRFSTVVGFRGSADTVRDVRGFATKFYTSEGNFDLVGNNMPVFFIQDAMKFPDLVHSIKPEPHHEMPQASAAHDNFWDFASLMPESVHMLMWVLSDRALPRSYRMMEGFGVHTFRFVNDDGRSRFVKWHWKPLLGAHSLVWDEVQKLAGKDPDFNRRDLWESIEQGDYPEFELGVQIVEPDQADDFDFDLLDATKIIPEELVPVRRIGKMTLTRNPTNFFSETEQVAFHPGHVVPGIDFTNDPLLQGRLFSYLDTQLIRLGGPNFTEIPINRPLAEVHNNQRDGHMRQTVHEGPVNYEPNSLGGGCPMASPGSAGGFVSFPEHMDGTKVRHRSESFDDHFTQATLFWHSQTEVEQQHIVDALHFELGKVDHVHVRQRICDLLFHVDRDLADRAAAGVGVERVTGDLSYLDEGTAPRPGPARSAAAPGRSPSLSQADQPGSPRSRKVAVLVAEGYDHASVTTVLDGLREAGVRPATVSSRLGTCHGQGGEVDVDKTFDTAASIMFDAVLVAGGAESAGTLAGNGDALHFVNEAFKHCKPVAALGAGVDLLHAASLPQLAMAGADTDDVNEDRGVVTGGSGADPGRFTGEFLAAISAHRHWSRSLHPVPA